MRAVPPRLVRRLVVAPLVVLLEAALIIGSPLLAVVAVVVSPLAGGWRPVRLLAIVVGYAARHLAGTLACFGLWVADGLGTLAASPRSLDNHYALLAWFVGGVHRSVTRWARVTVEVTGAEALSARPGPLVVLSRHAGEGDSLLVLHQLLCRFGRRPRIVLHHGLAMDPLIDVLGRRLPNRFVDPRGGDTEAEIAAMSRDLGADGAVLIFPEGGNFSPARRLRGIERLEQAGHDEEATWARDMDHVVAPRPGGALAAIEAAPDADVVFVGHVGVPVGFADLWRLLPARQTVKVRMWRVEPQQIPAAYDDRIDWLFAWWRTLDDWVGEQHQPNGTA